MFLSHHWIISFFDLHFRSFDKRCFYCLSFKFQSHFISHLLLAIFYWKAHLNRCSSFLKRNNSCWLTKSGLNLKKKISSADWMRIKICFCDRIILSIIWLRTKDCSYKGTVTEHLPLSSWKTFSLLLLSSVLLLSLGTIQRRARQLTTGFLIFCLTTSLMPICQLVDEARTKLTLQARLKQVQTTQAQLKSTVRRG